MDPRPRVSPAELQLLNYINENNPATVRDVAEHFGQLDGRARTTVLTLMERLRKKGYLNRRQSGGVNEYSPNESKADTLRGVVQDFVQRTLGGSVTPFVAYLGNDADLSDEELSQLKNLVAKLDARRAENE